MIYDIYIFMIDNFQITSCLHINLETNIEICLHLFQTDTNNFDLFFNYNRDHLLLFSILFLFFSITFAGINNYQS